MTRTVLLFGIAALCASTALPQSASAPAPLAASVDVKVVNVDVAVTDGTGTPVNDLTRDDFEVLEDGQPQTITNFYVTSKTVRRSSDSGETTPQPAQRKIIVVVDNNYIDARERSLALDTLDRFVEDRFDEDSQWSVATIGQMLEVIQPLTTDRAAIHAAVAKARRTGTVSLRTEALDREILADPFRRAEGRGGYDYEETVR